MKVKQVAASVAIALFVGAGVQGVCYQTAKTCTDGDTGFCSAHMTVCEQGLRATYSFECGWTGLRPSALPLLCKEYLSVDPSSYYRGPCDKDHIGYTRISPDCQYGTGFLNCCWVKNGTGVKITNSGNSAILPNPSSPTCGQCP